MKKPFSTQLLAVFVMSVLGALLFISLFGYTRFSIDALEFQLSIRLCEQGITQIELPPLGVVRARTHKTPLLLTARLENIDLTLMEQLLAETPDQPQLVTRVKKRAQEIVRYFAAKILALAALGGGFGVFLLRKTSLRAYLLGGGTGLLLAGVLLGGTYFTFNTNSFQNPEYRGLLQAAPWAVNLAQKTLGTIDSLSTKMQVMADSLYNAFQRMDELQPLNENTGDIKVLHVSDIHNNPAAFDFINRVAHNFNVNLIIDTGDISDYGTPLEALLLKKLEDIPTPYIFVAGNHDSPIITEKMSNLPGVLLLDGYIDIGGLRILGFPDPSSTGNDIASPDPEQVPEYVNKILAKLKDIPEGVDILAVHNHRIGEKLAGSAPTVLFGHNHQQLIREQKGSVLVNAGTSGASGFRGLQSIHTPYTVVLLHFRQVKGEMVPMAADTIKVYNLNSGFTVERKVFTVGKNHSDNENIIKIKQY